MTSVQFPNRDALQQGLNIFRSEMARFIVRQLRQRQGNTLVDVIASSLTDRQVQEFTDNLRESGGKPEEAIEIGFIPRLIERNWTDIFQNQLGGNRTIRNTLQFIRDLRNDLAHDKSGKDFPLDKVETGLYLISEALVSINCPEQQKQVLEIRTGIRKDGVQAPGPELEATSAELPSNGTANPLKPWREVIPPSADVSDGSFHDSDFAASLQQVYDGTAPAVYGDPLEFFHRTHITAGLRNLLIATVKRLSANGGNSVIQTQTGFGGGKTHSLIAVFHLVNSLDALLRGPDTPQYSRIQDEVKAILGEGGFPESGIGAHMAVLSGTWLSPNRNSRTDTGDPLDTLWGEMAWQLGGQSAYEAVGNAARNGSAPGGEELDELFNLVGPCVILIDELVNYARNADIDSVSTFLQNLTEAVDRRNDVLLIVSLPVNTYEAGGPRGMEILPVFEATLQRVQSLMKVTDTGTDEAFAVVRRRLFQDECDEAGRDATCQSYQRMYQRGTNDYPPEAREGRYLERLRQCYPIHPEIFDRLYQDWSTHPEFQRTRGVLRSMAYAISRLYVDGDTSPMIMPGNLPFSDSKLNGEFLSLLGPNWDAVVAEVDRENSRTHRIDMQQPGRFGAVGGAAKRVARTVFLGSSTRKSTRGIDVRQINLGVTVPGNGTATYRDAIDAMDNQLYHLYRDRDSRYYFDAEENLNKVANDRASEFRQEDLDLEVIRRLNEFRSVNQNRAVVVCPESPAEVPDSDFVRLVILRPNQSHSNQEVDLDVASEAAEQLLSSYGNNLDRKRTNTLIFLSPARNRLSELRDAARRFLAWDSVRNGDRRVQNLTGQRDTLTRNQHSASDMTLRNALRSAYRWIMAPVQPDPQKARYDTTRWKEIPDEADIAANAFENFVQSEQLIDKLTPTALNDRLSDYVWNGPRSRYHITVDDLWELLIDNIYMRLRLRSRTVLENCLAEGFSTGVFGQAEGYNSQTGQYQNLWLRTRDSQNLDRATQFSGSTLVVERSMAEIAKEEPRQSPSSTEDGQHEEKDEGGKERDTTTGSPDQHDEKRPRRFIARKTIEENVQMYDFNQIREEIARVLAVAGATVSVEIIVTGTKDDGFSETTTMNIRGNSSILGVSLEDDLEQ